METSMLRSGPAFAVLGFLAATIQGTAYLCQRAFESFRPINVFTFVPPDVHPFLAGITPDAFAEWAGVVNTALFTFGSTVIVLYYRRLAFRSRQAADTRHQDQVDILVQMKEEVQQLQKQNRLLIEGEAKSSIFRSTVERQNAEAESRLKLLERKIEAIACPYSTDGHARCKDPDSSS